MTDGCTIECELRLPAAFLHDKHLDDITQLLRHAGVLPVAVQECRWRLDTDRPGGYIVMFSVRVSPTL